MFYNEIPKDQLKMANKTKRHLAVADQLFLANGEEHDDQILECSPQGRRLQNQTAAHSTSRASLLPSSQQCNFD
jgi:hypothetical protein